MNPRSGTVHRSVCHYIARAPHPVEPLTIEAATTHEAIDRIRELGLDPCRYCLPRGLDQRGQRYAAVAGGGESEEDEEEEVEEGRWQVVDTETNEVVERFVSRRDAVSTARQWSRAVEEDPEMTPRRAEATQRLKRAYSARRNAQIEWFRAIHEMHAEGFTPAEIGSMVSVTAEEIAAEIAAALGADLRHG